MNLKERVFQKIELSQQKAIDLNDIKTAIKLNWIKYSLTNDNINDMIESYMRVLINNKLLIK